MITALLSVYMRDKNNCSNLYVIQGEVKLRIVLHISFHTSLLEYVTPKVSLWFCHQNILCPHYRWAWNITI